MKRWPWHVATLACALAFCGVAVAAAAAVPTWRAETADQFQWPAYEDIVPGDPAVRRAWAHALAFDATLYGTIAVLQYGQMHAQAIDREGPGYTGFNVFAHDRVLAGPGYAPFKTPNADTLYSNAWLDLSHGPVLLEMPDTAGRYYTANFLDAYGNATNISARTHGTKGGRYLIVPANWDGAVPEGARVFRVTTPYVWILLRILATDDGDVRRSNALQDRFRLIPQYAGDGPVAAWPDSRTSDAPGFFRVLDAVLRANGVPVQETALVHRYRGIGIGGPQPFDVMVADAEIRAGLESGYAAAQAAIAKSIGRTGRPFGAWMQASDIGRYGFNYLMRATIATLGTGANVIDENFPFTTFRDADGETLDGSRGPYELVLAPPPPAKFFWSVTVYDAATRELFPNAANKYLVSDRTPGLVRGRDGSVTVRFESGTPPLRARANWIPVPKGPFYVALRAQGPEAELRDGRWLPPPIRRVEPDAGRDADAAIFAGATQDPTRLAMRAYVWGMPLVEAARIRERATLTGPQAAGTPLNHFAHSRRLAGPEFRRGVGPNNDTIYSIAWLDLADGPFVLETPDFGGRYYTFSFNYADSSSELSLGQRTHGGQLPPVFVQGPDSDEPVPPGMLGVRSPTRYLNLAGRILVRGPDDYPVVHALQDRLQLRPWSAYREGRPAPADAPPQRPLVAPDTTVPEAFAFLERLGNVLQDWKVDPADAELIASFHTIGLTPERGFDFAALDATRRVAVLLGLQQGQQAVRERSLHLGVERNGWTTNLRGSRFGRNFLLRAAVAKDQIYVAIPEEAVYPIGRVDRDGRPLDGRNVYRIHMPAGQAPPAGAFWSITAYDDDGHMVPNAIDRYSVGDRTAGLTRGADGSIDIVLSHARPAAGGAANWLPVPAAPFYLMMRLYMPRAEVLEGRWSPPAIERVAP